MKQTRLKLVIGMVFLALIEGLVKAFLAGFPLTEVFAIQSAVVGAYIAGKTLSGVKGMKYENNGKSD